LPLKIFAAQAPIIPTGTKIYPAAYAEGVLTLTNGSVLSEVLPQGVIFRGASGAEVQTEQAVFIPAGSATGYGVATVPAKALAAGKSGNIASLAINAVYGTALYVRNLTAFSGGKDSYSAIVQLPKDRQAAINRARAFVALQKARTQATLASPCTETAFLSEKVVRLSWGCQFAVYHVPSYMRVVAARLSGKHFLVDVAFIPRPQRMWVR
jgi:Baseplate J-like protein